MSKLIAKYMGLDPNDFCKCSEARHKYNESMEHTHCVWCKMKITPDYENSLDTQQPVIEKMSEDDLEAYQKFMWLEFRNNDIYNITYQEFLLKAPPQTRYKAIMKVLEEL